MINKIFILAIFISTVYANNYNQLSHAVKELIVDMELLRNNLHVLENNFSSDLNKSIISINNKLKKLELKINDNINDTLNNKNQIDDIYNLLNMQRDNFTTNNKNIEKEIKFLKNTVTNNNQMINQNSKYLNLIQLNSKQEINNDNLNDFSNEDIQKAKMLNLEFKKVSNDN